MECLEESKPQKQIKVWLSIKLYQINRPAILVAWNLFGKKNTIKDKRHFKKPWPPSYDTKCVKMFLSQISKTGSSVRMGVKFFFGFSGGLEDNPPPPPLWFRIVLMFLCFLLAVLLACQKGWWCTRITLPRVWKIDTKFLRKEKKCPEVHPPPPTPAQRLFQAWRGIMACNVKTPPLKKLCIRHWKLAIICSGKIVELPSQKADTEKWCNA